MNKKLFLSVSLVSFCAFISSAPLFADSEILPIQFQPQATAENAHLKTLKTFKSIKKTVKIEIIKELLRKLVLLSLEQGKSKKHFDRIAVKESQGSSFAKDKSNTRLLEITSPQSFAYHTENTHPVASYSHFESAPSINISPLEEVIPFETKLQSTRSSSDISSADVTSPDIHSLSGDNTPHAHHTQHNNVQDMLSLIDLGDLKIYRDPQGKFLSINDKVLLTKKGLTRLKNRIAHQEKAIQHMRNRLQILSQEFASGSITEEEFLMAQIELNKAVTLCTSLKEAQKIHQQELSSHGTLLTLLDQLPHETARRSTSKSDGSGLAEAFFQSFDATEQSKLSEKSELWKEQNAIQESLNRLFGMNVPIESPAIIAIYKLHKEIARENPHQTIENTTYFAGRSIITEVIDALGEDRETQQMLSSLLPPPKRYASEKLLIDDYTRRLSNFPIIFGEDTNNIIKRHFEQTGDIKSERAASAHTFLVKLLDLSLRLSKGIHGARAVANIKFNQNDFLEDVARTIAPLKSLFGPRSVLEALQDTFNAIDLSVERSGTITEEIQNLIVARLVGANKHETLQNLSALYTSLTGDVKEMQPLIERRFKNASDNPADLKIEIAAFIDDNSGKHDYLEPLRIILQGVDAIVSERLSPLQGRQLAGSKLSKIIQETHLATYCSSHTKTNTPNEIIGTALNELIKQEFKGLAIKNQALSTPVETLTKNLFLDGLFEGVALCSEERDEIADHIRKVITLFKLSDTMGRQERERRENDLLTPAFKKLTHKVVTLISNNAYAKSSIDVKQELRTPSDGSLSARHLKQNMTEITQDLAIHLDQAIIDLKSPLEALSEREMKSLLTFCIDASEKTKSMSQQNKTDILDLLMSGIKRASDVLSEMEEALPKAEENLLEPEAKKALAKTHIKLDANYKTTLRLLGGDALTQKQALTLRSSKEKLWLYNALVDLGEEAVVLTPNIEQRLHRIIDQSSKANAEIAYTHADFLEDVLNDRLTIDAEVSSDAFKEKLSAFEITLASSLAWQKHGNFIKQEKLKNDLNQKSEEEEISEIQSTMQNFFTLFTPEIRAALGLSLVDNNAKVFEIIKNATQNQHDLLEQMTMQQRKNIKKEKDDTLGMVGILALKDLPLIQIFSDPEKLSKNKFQTHLDRLFKKVSKHLSFLENDMIQGFMLMLSEKLKIHTPDDLTREKGNLKKGTKVIAKQLLEQFYALFGVINEADVIGTLMKRFTPFDDTLDGNQKNIMKVYATYFFNKARRHYFEHISSGLPLDLNSLLDQTENKALENTIWHISPYNHALFLELDHEVPHRLKSVHYGDSDIKKIIHQAKRILIAKQLHQSPKETLEQVLTLAIAQSMDAANRKTIQTTPKHQTLQRVDFDEIARKSSVTLERLMMTKLLGLDESITTKGQYADCFSSLEAISPSLLLNGLVGLIDELTLDGLEKGPHAVEARYQTKKALMKRFAKFETYFFNDGFMGEALQKKTIPLKQNFTTTLLHELHHTEKTAQLEVLATLNNHQLQNLYNTIVFEPEDMVAYVDNQLITHRLVRMISAAHMPTPMSFIDYTFHDFMDTVVHGIDADAIDLDFTENSVIRKNERLFDLDRLIVGKLSWEKMKKERDPENNMTLKKSDGKNTEDIANEIKNRLLKKGVKKDAIDF